MLLLGFKRTCIERYKAMKLIRKVKEFLKPILEKVQLKITYLQLYVFPNGHESLTFHCVFVDCAKLCTHAFTSVEFFWFKSDFLKLK